LPDAPGLELIRGEIERDCPGAVLATSFDRSQAALIADPERILDVLRWLRDQPGQRYDFLSSLHAADYLPAQPRFAVHYELINRDRVERIRVKAMLEDASPAGGDDREDSPGRESPRSETGPAGHTARAALLAAFVALLVHTLSYAGFFEDPITWVLLAVGASLAWAEGPTVRDPA
jgi:respiratory-subunit NADH dehydrogenase subunit